MYSLKELNMEDTGIETIEGVYYESGYGTTPFAEPIPLENLRLPKNIKVIGKNAFYGVNPPTELHLPATIESLGEKFNVFAMNFSQGIRFCQLSKNAMEEYYETVKDSCCR